MARNFRNAGPSFAAANAAISISCGRMPTTNLIAVLEGEIHAVWEHKLNCA